MQYLCLGPKLYRGLGTSVTTEPCLLNVAQCAVLRCDDWTDSRDELAGVVEMGGASTQIAFVPEGNILADKFPVLIGGKRYPLYVHSYLYYGQNVLDYRLKRLLVADQSSSSSTQAIVHPCMLRGKLRVELLRSFEPINLLHIYCYQLKSEHAIIAIGKWFAAKQLAIVILIPS